MNDPESKHLLKIHIADELQQAKRPLSGGLDLFLPFGLNLLEIK